MKNKKVSNKTKSPKSSLLFKGQGTEHTTVKWPTLLLLWRNTLNADDVIFFFLYLMNKMRGNLVKLPGTINADDVIAFCSLLDLC